MNTSKIVSNKIETLFDLHLNEAQQPLDDDELNLLLILVSLKSDDDKNHFVKQVIEDERFWVFEAMKKRVESCLTIDIDDLTLCFLSFINECNIGQCLIYCYWLQYQAKKLNIQQIHFKSLIRDFLGHGLLDKQKMKDFWYDQKYTFNDMSCNMIDNNEYCKSIQF